LQFAKSDTNHQPHTTKGVTPRVLPQQTAQLQVIPVEERLDHVQSLNRLVPWAEQGKQKQLSTVSTVPFS
jgi:hypothetical protein